MHLRLASEIKTHIQNVVIFVLGGFNPQKIESQSRSSPQTGVKINTAFETITWFYFVALGLMIYLPTNLPQKQM